MGVNLYTLLGGEEPTIDIVVKEEQETVSIPQSKNVERSNDEE